MYMPFAIHSKDVRLPTNLQRAMAAEAEAAREAKAKVKLHSCSHALYAVCIAVNGDVTN